MSSVNRRVRGNFVSALQDLIPVLAVQPHQVTAAMHPENSTKSLAAKPKSSKRAPVKKINDHLSRRPR